MIATQISWGPVHVSAHLILQKNAEETNAKNNELPIEHAAAGNNKKAQQEGANDVLGALGTIVVILIFGSCIYCVVRYLF